MLAEQYSILDIGCIADRDHTDDYCISPILQELYYDRLQERLPL